MKKNTALEKIVQYITMHPHMDLSEGCELIVNWANAQVSADSKKIPDPVVKKVTPSPTVTPIATPEPTPVPVAEEKLVVEEKAKIGPSDDYVPSQAESDVPVVKSSNRAASKRI